MATRDDEAAQWQAISLSSRKAAQHLLEIDCCRSSISRAYYAAYAALTSALIAQGITFGQGGNNPGHAGLPVYILNNLTALPLTRRFDLNKLVRRLYRARAEADYVAAAAVDQAAAKRAIRDLSRILQLLDMETKPERGREN